MNDKKQLIFKATPEKCVYDSDTFQVYGCSVDIKKYPFIKLNKYNNISLIGDMQELNIGAEYDVVAVEEDGKRGLSYRVVKITQDIPLSGENVLKFLKSIIPVNRAEVLFEHHPDIIERVKNDDIDDIDPELMFGYGQKTLCHDIAKIVDNIERAEIISYFGDVLTNSQMTRLYCKYKSFALVKKKLDKYPYSALIQMDGIGFKTADKIVLKLNEAGLIEPDKDLLTSEDRCYAAVISLLEDNENNGNTVANMADIRSQCFELVGDAAHHFTSVMKYNDIYYDKDTLNVALRRTYNQEQYIASHIIEGMKFENKWDIDCSKYNKIGDFDLTEEQAGILPMVCANNVCMLVGVAGSGKSSSLDAVLNMLDDNGKTYKLLAPTGRASKVIKEATGRNASTIHRGLGYSPFGFAFNEECKMLEDIIIVDEMSMVDVFIMKSLVAAIDFEHTKLLMVGDPAQIASVGAGRVFGDFISSGIVPKQMLTKIFRYGSAGLITVATKTRNNERYLGNDNVQVFGEDKGYTFINTKKEDTLQTVKAVYNKLISRDGVSVNDVCVLSAYNVGEFGSMSINNMLQKIANPKGIMSPCMEVGEKQITKFYKDDVVINKRNNYDAILYPLERDELTGEYNTAFISNGDVGVVKDVNSNNCIIEFDGIQVIYSKTEMLNVKLAYSYSMHSSQGGSIKYPIIITPSAHTFFLDSNLLYVALTRTIESCIHIGSKKTVDIAVKKSANDDRKTLLEDMLKELSDNK